MRPTRTTTLAIVTRAALAGCAAPTVFEARADVPTRMNTIAGRYNKAFQDGGMAGVTNEVERCYALNTFPLCTSTRFAIA